MKRHVTRMMKADTIIDNGDMRLLRALPQAQRTAVGPFVFVDHYRHQGLKGIGDRPHPHAGIEVVSYLLEGSVEHRDSMGFRDRLTAGDAQFIRSGRGMLHAEQPLSGRHGLQLWTSLPPELKLVEPEYHSFRATDIPEIVADSTRVRVIAGRIGEVNGPMALSGGAVFSVIQLQPNATIRMDVDTHAELGLYALQGQADISGVTLPSGGFAILSQGDQIDILAQGEQTIELALIGGEPVKGNVLFSGPFVMDTRERLDQAKRDFSVGRMGRLEGVPF